MSEYQNNQQNNGNNNWQNRGGNNNWQNRGGGNGGGNNNFQRKPWSGGGVRFHAVLMESKLRLSGEKEAGLNYINDFPPSLQVRLYETNPRIVVKPNIEGEQEEIALRMDPIIAEMFFNTILEACEQKAGWRNAIVFKNRDPETKKIYDEARAVVGRHADNGVVYIEVSPLTSESRLKVTFNFASRAFTDWVYGDGTKMSPEDLSGRYAKSWAGKMMRLLDVVMATIPFKKKEYNGAGQGQQNNNWKNRQQNNGGGNNNWQNRQNNNGAAGQQQRPQYGQDNSSQHQPAQQPAPQTQNREYIKSNNDFDQYDDVPE